MPETTPLIKAALNLRVGAGFDVYITQAELAERADVSLYTIKSVENGRRAMSLDTYLNLE